jgi:hypothetical protein
LKFVSVTRFANFFPVGPSRPLDARRCQARAFDPFYTTKPIGQGTSLGLSMIYDFILQSDGSVRIESEPGMPKPPPAAISWRRASNTAGSILWHHREFLADLNLGPAIHGRKLLAYLLVSSEPRKIFSA